MNTISKAVFAFTVLFASQSFAIQAIDTADIAQLPVLQNVKLTQTVVGPMLTVQPQALIEFTYRSCAPRFFEANIEEMKGILFVSIIEKIGLDCMGPTMEREYSVQYSSDATENQKVVILNSQTLLSPNFF